eukprot:scaffold4368_cov348-Prasinococcus_capsulatus_cf.AAC.4
MQHVQHLAAVQLLLVVCGAPLRLHPPRGSSSPALVQAPRSSFLVMSGYVVWLPAGHFATWCGKLPTSPRSMSELYSYPL